MSMQSNVIPMKNEARELRRARGRFVESLIKADDRSARYVAIQIGLNPTSMGERLKGKSPFLADELENIARVLKINPVEFYARYIAVGTENGPASEETGPKLPHLDSNQEPIG